MAKKAIILDLDNTIYSVASIADELFAVLFKMIISSGAHEDNMQAIQHDLMRRPFQLVAADHGFSATLMQSGIDLLKEMKYTGPIEAFADYAEVRNWPQDKFLVTTGFVNLQQSKIKGMGIEKDFKEIHIADPLSNGKTKKDVFADIIRRNAYHINEVIVVGDDLHSEIKAGQQLGIDTVLYDKFNVQKQQVLMPTINDFTELKHFIF